MSLLARAFQLCSLAWLIGGCEGPPGSSTIVLDWLDGSIPVHHTLEEGLLVGGDLVRPWNEGLSDVPDEEGVVWTLGPHTRLQFEILEGGAHDLILEAQPPSQSELETQIRFDGAQLLVHDWTGRERLEIALPADSLGSGLHEVEITSSELYDGRGLGLRAAGLRREASPEQESLLWWRWSALPSGSRLELRGRSQEAAALRLLVDAADGSWAPLWSRTIAPGERFESSIPLEETAGLGMARLALLGEGRGLELDLLRQLVPTDANFERRHLFLITLDTTRWDALGFYRDLDPQATDLGVDESPSPRLDALARDATVWAQALAPSPVTAPTHASLFLSRPPRLHGLDGNGRPLPRSHRGNLACYLEAWGYANAGFVSLGVLKADLGFAQGFSHFSDELGDRWHRPAEKLQESFRSWIADLPELDDRPRFVWIHYSDPHMPYGPPDAGDGVLITWDDVKTEKLSGTGRARRFVFAGNAGTHRLRFHGPPGSPADRAYKLLRFRLSDDSIPWGFGPGFYESEDVLHFRSGAEITVELGEDGPPGIRVEVGIEDVLTDLEQRRRYAADVRIMDDAIAESLELLDARGWLEEGLICAVGDHGEDLGLEDGRWGHVEHVGPSLSRVPMFLVDPREPAKVVEGLVGVVDLAPTLGARLGLPPLPTWDGSDVFEDAGSRPLHLESFPPEARRNWRALVREPYELVGCVSESGELDGPLRLYDLRRDPQCLDNLLAAGRPTAVDADARQALVEEWTRWLSAAEVDARGERGIDPRVEERLRALGYLD